MDKTISKRIQLDQQIVNLLNKGDRQGMQLAYQHYAKILYGYILKVVRSQETAEEVLQDTFVKIWKNSTSYDSSKSQFFTWIVNIAKNTAIDAVRSARFQRENKTDSLDSNVTVSNNLSETLATSDSGLQKVIEGLDEKYRLLIDLTFFQGYSQREIAKEFDIPLGTVKTRYRKAINELRDNLSEEHLQNLLFAFILLNNIKL